MTNPENVDNRTEDFRSRPQTSSIRQRYAENK